MAMTAANRIAALEAENAALKVEVERQRAEILHLRIYAPVRNVARAIRVTPQIAPTNFVFYGLPDVETDFDSFGHAVPNESEA